jgi:hypothetical protein
MCTILMLVLTKGRSIVSPVVIGPTLAGIEPVQNSVGVALPKTKETLRT